MRNIVIWVSNGVGEPITEEIEVDDNATDEEIDEIVSSYVHENILEYGWHTTDYDWE